MLKRSLLVSLLLTGCVDEPDTSAELARKLQPGNVWVANRIPGSIDLFDARSSALLGSVRVGNGTLDIALPDGVGKIYGSDESSGTISAVDVASMTRVAVISIGAGTKPHHMDSNPDGTLVYASLFGRNKLVAVNTATDTVAWTQSLGPSTAFVHGTAINAAGDTLWVTNGSAGTFFAIHELDAHTGEIRRSQQVNFDWSEVHLSHDETQLYASDKTFKRIRVFDVATLTEVASVSVPQTPDTMSLNNNGKTLLVGLRDTPATCVFIDLDTMTTNVLPLSNKAGTSTGHHDITDNGKWAFISVDGANAPPHVAVLNMDTQTVHTRWNDPGRPHGIIFQATPEADISE